MCRMAVLPFREGQAAGMGQQKPHEVQQRQCLTSEEKESYPTVAVDRLGAD